MPLGRWRPPQSGGARRRSGHLPPRGDRRHGGRTVHHRRRPRAEPGLFTEQYGAGPTHVLRSRRPCAVRGVLIAVSFGTHVAEIAGRLGLRHLGQFAADYRAHFEELPSDTLRRAPAGLPRRPARRSRSPWIPRIPPSEPRLAPTDSVRERPVRQGSSIGLQVSSGLKLSITRNTSRVPGPRSFS